MKKLSGLMPYGPDLPVQKIECRNHLLRNVGSKLQALTKITNFPVSQRKLVTENIVRLRMAITKAARFRREEDVAEEEKVANLRKDILNAPYHVFGSHGNCRYVQLYCELTVSRLCHPKFCSPILT